MSAIRDAVAFRMSTDGRSLTPEQHAAVRAVLPSLSCRDRLLWLLSYHTAGRISSTLSVRVGDVVENGVVRTHVRIDRRNLKGGGMGRARRGVQSRVIPIHSAVAEAIRAYLDERRQAGPVNPDEPVFLSSQRGAPITVMQAWRIFRRLYAKVGLTAPGYATHVTSRTAARTLYVNTKDIELVRAALGHKSVVTTQVYIRASEDDAAQALLEL